jgi:hypothetical protein
LLEPLAIGLLRSGEVALLRQQYLLLLRHAVDTPTDFAQTKLKEGQRQSWLHGRTG